MIEIMMVIVIIGILVAIAVPNFLSYREKGKLELAVSGKCAAGSLGEQLLF